MTSRPADGIPGSRTTAAAHGAHALRSAGAERPGFLEEPRPRLLMFGGKGGVGKTSMAAAAALHWARRAPGEVLVVSTDPAHSLGDAFDQAIGDQVVAVEGEPGLFALALDARTRLDAFKERYGGALGTIIERGTYFDDDDVRTFLELSLPGIDEMMAVLEIAEIVREGRYSTVILDTAPTGHTLRLLAMPELLTRWLRALDLMLRKHRYIQSVFGGRRRDETDVFMERISDDLDGLRALLRDPRTTEFVAITVPEQMSVRETSCLLQSLDDMDVPVRTVLVNRVARVADAAECAFCAGRWRAQQPSLRGIEARYGAREADPRATGTGTPDPRPLAAGVPLQPRQIHGLPRLHELADLLREARVFGAAEAPASEAAQPEQGVEAPDWHLATSPYRHVGTRISLDQSFLFVGGKGGTGKTTVASAAAVHLARKRAEDGDTGGTRRVLLLSADPAHSLSDCLGQDLGTTITEVAGVPGLDALEMEPTTLLDALLQTYSAEATEVFTAFGGGGDLDVAFNGEVMRALASLAPPGLDELAALLRLVNLVHDGRHDAYVVDLAPTGHALRLLETPGLAREWFTALFSTLIKYQNVLSLADAGELLRQKSKQLRELQRLLADPVRCGLVAVTIPEVMALRETQRLLDSLAGLSVRCGWIVANMVTAPSVCSFCAAVHEEQRQQLEVIEGLDLPWVQVPAFADEPRGPAALAQLARLIFT